MSEELKGCPFCGKAPYTVTAPCGTKTVWHVCEVMAAMLEANASTEQAAIHQWNTRAPQPAASVDREALIEFLNAELSESYDCTRVWEAWSVGTMGEDDFHHLSERVPEIADALIAAGWHNRPEAVVRDEAQASFQHQVDAWVIKAFPVEARTDQLERLDRFLEEALELAQALGYARGRVESLAAYVWSRPVGEPQQETGGVLLTLAALCTAAGLDMDAAGKAELARVWGKIDAIRAKQAAKPVGSALPQAWPTTPSETAGDKVEALVNALKRIRSLARMVAHDLTGRVEGGKVAAVQQCADVADDALASIGGQRNG